MKKVVTRTRFMKKNTNDEAIPLVIKNADEDETDSLDDADDEEEDDDEDDADDDEESY